MTGDTQFLLTTVVDVKDDGPLPHAVLDAGINVAEPVTSEYHQLLSVTSPLAGDDAVPARRSDLHAGRRLVPALAAAAAGPGRRAGDHGLGRLLRAVLDDVLFPEAGDRGAETAPSASRSYAAAETFDDMISLDSHPSV